MLMLAALGAAALASEPLSLPSPPPALVVGVQDDGAFTFETCPVDVDDAVLDCPTLPAIDVELEAQTHAYTLELVPLSEQQAPQLETVVVYNPASASGLTLIEQVVRCARCEETFAHEVGVCTELFSGHELEDILGWGNCVNTALAFREACVARECF